MYHKTDSRLPNSSFLFFAQIGKIDDFFFLRPCVFHRLKRAAGFMLHIENDEIRPIDHTAVPQLERSFEMRPGRLFADFDFIVVFPEGLFIVEEVISHIRQNQNMRAIIIPERPLRSYDCR